MTVSLSGVGAGAGSVPVAGGRAALVILALAVGGFAIGTGEFAVMSLLPYFTAGLGISAPEGGHVISAYALGVVVGAPLIAVAAARMARRNLLILLMLVYAGGHIASALATSYESLMAFRFISGLPHGAYFGVASLLAAGMVDRNRRASAVARVMLGLTAATLVGVPAATWLGQWAGWRWSFGLVGVLALVTVTMLALFAPRAPAAHGASPLTELGALRRPQVLLTALTGAIGFGGMFAVYTYLGPTLTEVTGVPDSVVPLVLLCFGLGMICGNLVCGWAADRALMPAIAAVLAWSALSLLIFSLVASHIWAVAVVVFLIGCGGGLGACLQTRLMDVAQDAQTLAAAMNHSALNIANALGPWVGGLAISAGMGWASTGWVGALLALAGLAVFLVSWNMERQALRRA